MKRIKIIRDTANLHSIDNGSIFEAHASCQGVLGVFTKKKELEREMEKY